ncbi:hypothetical protein NQ318_020637 [Aromia moschata]|uniref:Transposase n=1 Tax=Aromia moschata TaxID=1265417 RepID=A0AAV8XDI8_9CUCU|nr:hypothetical protein NQ318_020637 [Aromia moschata]
MDHVRKVPSKRQAFVDDDTKFNLLLALEENPITPARTAERTLILISRQTKITTCKCLECKRTAETFGHQNT